MYYVYLSDAPTDALKMKVNNKREAIKEANQYIKLWGIDAIIEKIEKMEYKK